MDTLPNGLPRQRGVVNGAIYGIRSTGKTTFLLGLCKKYSHTQNNRFVLILNASNAPALDDPNVREINKLSDLHPRNRKRGIWIVTPAKIKNEEIIEVADELGGIIPPKTYNKDGTERSRTIKDPDSLFYKVFFTIAYKWLGDQANKNDKDEHCLVVFDECINYMGPNTPFYQRNPITQSGNKGVSMLFVFHTLASTPNYMKTFLDCSYIINTGETLLEVKDLKKKFLNPDDIIKKLNRLAEIPYDPTARVQPVLFSHQSPINYLRIDKL
jgi:hypothetical protein